MRKFTRPTKKQHYYDKKQLAEDVVNEAKALLPDSVMDRLSEATSHEAKVEALLLEILRAVKPKDK